MMKRISISLLLILCFTACTPRVGVGIGGIVASGDSISGAGIYTDSESGVHGSITTGTSIGL